MCEVTIKINDRETGEVHEVTKQIAILHSHHGDFFEIQCEGTSLTVYQLERLRAIGDFISRSVGDWLNPETSE